MAYQQLSLTDFDCLFGYASWQIWRDVSFLTFIVHRNQIRRLRMTMNAPSDIAAIVEWCALADFFLQQPHLESQRP